MRKRQEQKYRNKSQERRWEKARNQGFYLFISMLTLMSFSPGWAEGVSSQAAQCARSYSRFHGGTALLIKQGNAIVLEKYDNGGSATRRSLAFSMTKSFCSLMAMAGEADRFFSLDEKVADTILEWRRDPLKSQITVRELLNQTSGLATGYNALYANSVSNKGCTAVKVATLYEPGSTFLYGPSHWEVFEEFLRRKLKSRGMSPLIYLRRKVLGACGIDVSGWRTDHAGNPYFSTGAMLTARQLTQAGDLLLNSGRWNFIQLIPRKDLLTLSGTPANPMYGMGFWLNRNSKTPGVKEVAIEQHLGGGYSASSWKHACISKYAPPDLIAMVGSRGQRLYVIPSRQLVIARQGVSDNFRDSEFLRILFNE